MSLYTDKTGLSYFLSKLKEKLDKRFLRNPINGDLQINGNMTASGKIKANEGEINSGIINGKLVVDEVQVTNRLLIGDIDPANPDNSNFMTKDDLQKLQDKIIAPEQNIYIDSINGNDETGNGTYSKPYKTVDNAVKNIKAGVPTIIFHLFNESSNQEYDFTPIDFHGTSVTTFRIQATNWLNAKDRDNYPIINIGYGKAFQGNDTGVTKYYWGNFLCANVDNILIFSSYIKIKNNHTGNSFIHSLFLSKTCYTNLVKMEIGEKNLFFPAGNYGNALTIITTKFINCTGYLIKGGDMPNSENEPDFVSTEVEKSVNYANAALVSGDIKPGAIRLVNTVFVYNTTLPESIISNGTDGFASDVNVGQKNW